MDRKQEWIGIAKRENNKKRNYLIVNKLQGKHVPVSPARAFSMFDELAQGIETEYKEETLLLIGFAETATAIGARIATRLNTYYIQTTREEIENVNYLFFTEAHSHAMEQKLVKEDIEQAVHFVDRIIFIEDEITTGNTILNIVNLIEKCYPNKVSFSVASLLNGMDPEAQKRYQERNIRIHYLLKIYHTEFAKKAEQYLGNGEYYKKKETVVEAISPICISHYKNARRLIKGNEYLSACEYLWNQIKDIISLDNKKKLLVLGTEEFMFPALFIAKKIEEMGIFVRSHSTTRSPIVVSLEPEYPFHKRYELLSMYDKARKTFLYDLMAYDEVFILTDAQAEWKEGVDSLVYALHSCGNYNIKLFQWCES